ncbi:Pr6Pr family membrane protein [Microbacterium koreense]|uniref:Pr6Pr family membrane protein n=1 Tax=Microbacterium koreense TaxID=323761 RepID=A0ABW2ZNL7_9MICO
MLRSPGWSLFWSVLRLVMAVAIIAAIIAQLIASVTRAQDRGDDVGTVVMNFFSFFTILSNAGAAVVLLIAAGWFVWRGRRRAAPVEPRALAVALVSVSTYMVITGIVYNLLLRGIELPQGSEPIPWSNETLHLVGPLFLLLDVLIGPARRRPEWRTIGIVVIFPVVWVVYTLLRGPFVVNPVTGANTWYPYPFLDPAGFDAGYGAVAIYVVAIAAAIVGVAALIVWVGRRRGAVTEPVGA